MHLNGAPIKILPNLNCRNEPWKEQKMYLNSAPIKILPNLNCRNEPWKEQKMHLNGTPIKILPNGVPIVNQTSYYTNSATFYVTDLHKSMFFSKEMHNNAVWMLEICVIHVGAL